MRTDSNTLVQTSWEKVAAMGPQAAQLFYFNLFALDPDLQSMFKTDMQTQSERLIRAIGMAISKLDDTDTLLPILRSLGQRHVGYGVLPRHYDSVGAALLQTLQQGLAADFTPAVRQAWMETYALIARVMIEAAEELEAAAA